MYNNRTSNITGVLGATLGLPAAAPSPFGNASYYINNDLIISAVPILELRHMALKQILVFTKIL
jgi:hypothetical protein